MELEDRLAELLDGHGERRVGAIERRVRRRLGRLLELVPRGQQVLHGVVVERLGERLPLALLR